MPSRTIIISSLLFTLSLAFLAGCTTNPATGDKQFTALLSPKQESLVGAQEHEKIQATYGEFVAGPLAEYVRDIGYKIAVNTELEGVQYQFFVLDSPVVNAFALPGGYIYVSRGLLALANNEAELAAVLAHEIGHVTGRHAAERVSQNFLSSLGASILSAAVDVPGLGSAAGLGSELYIKSYSRDQEHQADELGVRYLARAGYDPGAMATFLSSLEAHDALEEKLAGRSGKSAFSYFSTHPRTQDRIEDSAREASSYGPNRRSTFRESYLKRVNGLVYGYSIQQGFVRGRNFYHPDIGFTFSVPPGFLIKNYPSQVVATNTDGSVVLFDADKNEEQVEPLTYLTRHWMRGEKLSDVESITVNGIPAATAAFPARLNGKAMTIRLVAIEWEPGHYFRFQLSIPNNVSTESLEGLKKATYSFRRLMSFEKTIKPTTLRLVTIGSGDTVTSVAQRMDVEPYKEERFRALNGLGPQERLIIGRQYKIVVN